MPVAHALMTKDSVANGFVGTSASFVPAANSLLLYWVSCRSDSSIPIPTISDSVGSTWTLVRRPSSSSNLARRGFFFAMLVGASPPARTVTLDFGSGNIDFAWVISNHTGIPTGETITQIMRVSDAYRTAGLAMARQVAMQDFVDPVNSGAYAAWYVGNSATATAGSGWTILGQETVGVVTSVVQVHEGERLVNDLTWDDDAHVGGIVMAEIRASGSPAFPPIRDPSLLSKNVVSGSGSVISSDVIQPTADALVVVVVTGGRSTGAQSPATVAGCGITFEQVGTGVSYDTVAAPTRRLTLWCGSSPSPTSGQITVTFPNSQDQGKRMRVFEVAQGVDLADGPLQAIAQFDGDAIDSGTSLAAALAAFADPNNATFGVWTGDQVQQADPVPEAGWEEVGNHYMGIGHTGIVWRAAPDTTPTLGLATSDAAAFLAFELRASGSAGGEPNPFQALRPSADQSNPDGWQTQAGGTTNIYQSIDEATLDTADYITTV